MSGIRLPRRNAKVYRQAAQDPGSVVKKNKHLPIQPTSKTPTSRCHAADGYFRLSSVSKKTLDSVAEPGSGYELVVTSQTRSAARLARARRACGIFLKKSRSKVVDDLDPYPTNISNTRGT